MRETPPLGLTGWVGLVAVLAVAVGLRVGYLMAYCDRGNVTPFAVQGGGPLLDVSPGAQVRGKKPNEFENLVENLRAYRWFGTLAPLADVEEATAHVAPGYYWTAALVGRDDWIRFLQAGLSVLTVGMIFFLVRLAFANDVVAIVAGLFAAIHPFWIVNMAELADGTLATFLFAASLMLGTLAARTGGPAASAVFGLSLAGLSLVRAELLPLAFVSLGWFLVRCRSFRLGWFAGLLAVLGFGNGLALWMIRDQSVFHQTLPIVDSAYLHAWIGVAPGGNSGPMDETALRASLSAERVQELIAEPNQAKRYSRLSHDVARQVASDPAEAIGRRIDAAFRFLVGAEWFRGRVLVTANGTAPESVETVLRSAAPLSLLVLLPLAFVGWRLSAGCGLECRLMVLACLLVPIPYVLTHGDAMSGPRLPWDAVLIVFAAYAVASMWPSVRAKTTVSNPPEDAKPSIQDMPTRQI